MNWADPKSVTLILLVDPSDRDYRVYILIRDVKYCYFYNLVLLQVHVRLVTIHLMTKTLISGLILSKLLNQKSWWGPWHKCRCWTVRRGIGSLPSRLRPHILSRIWLFPAVHHRCYRVVFFNSPPPPQA